MRNACKTFVISLSLILTASLSGATQDLLLVDRWRLEMAARELMQKDLQDSLLMEKDSLINTLKEISTTRLSMISSLNGVISEKDKQLELMSEINTTYINEVVHWRDEAGRRKKQRNVLGAAAAILLGFVVLK